MRQTTESPARFHQQRQMRMEPTNIADAMRRVASQYQESGVTGPAFVVAQVGGEPWGRAQIRSLLLSDATLGVFWLFVGFGRGKLARLL
ncbi:VWA domain-containing protein [Streptomyces melanogenes]|uniref:VWA domain-containing protein n=1 Tax=Streptomyces melanogenes TaxID=67326 RepID=UPI0037A8AA9F